MKILALGVATWDIVNLVERYPAEDEKVRALSQRQHRGGNAANTLWVLSQLGHRCEWAGMLAGDPAGDAIAASLLHNGIGCSKAVRERQASTPTSYISLSRDSASRTIVHHRELREFTAADFSQIDPGQYDWIHFEGREPAELWSIFERLQGYPEVRISLEVEKARPGIDRLFQFPSVLVFSRAYAIEKGAQTPDSFIAEIKPQCRRDAVIFLPWGAAGGYALADGQIHHAPALAPGEVVDTLGAGDVFNAAVIHGMGGGSNVAEVLQQACRLAGIKCTRFGLEGLVDHD